MAYPTGTNWLPTSQVIGVQPIASVSTTQNFPLGQIVTASDGTYGAGEFIYLKGVASTAAGDVVVYDPKAATTARAVTTTAARGAVAVAMGACVALNYGWYAISGVVPVNSGSNTVAAGAPAFITATAAQIDDAVSATNGIDGMTTQASNSGTFTICILQRPNANGGG